MDNNEKQESDDGAQGFTKPIEEQPEQALLYSKKTNTSIKKINELKKCVIEKLAKTREQLQIKAKDLESNSDSTMQNDTYVYNSLNLLAGGSSEERKTCNNLLTSASRKQTSTNLMTKKDLMAIIEGYEQLISKLISNNRNLLTLFGNAARKISVLKDLPLFEEIEKYRKKKTRNDSLFSDKVNKSESSSLLKSDKEFALSLRIEHKPSTIRTSVDTFCEYINKILSEIIPIYCVEAREKYRCSPEHIEDLEQYSNALVEGGFGKIVEEEIRINAKNNHQSFITMTKSRETNERDAFISLPVARRYALDGDVVRAFVINADNVVNENGEIEDESSNESINNDNLDNNISSVPDNKKCPNAFVIKIIKQTELRDIVGSINFTCTTKIGSELYYKLRPHDTKIPMVFIRSDKCEAELENMSVENICGMLYVAKILEVDIEGNCIGELVQQVGKVGCLKAEIKAILLSNGLKDLKPYEEKYEIFEKSPNDTDLKHREDLRKRCIFTIDPLTAKDLDDAVSVERISNYEYEIGVHISDVSFYLQENSELDNLVKQRATSVYLVDQVIHMLPTSLCLRCSLLPGEDKCAFSVFWKWDSEKEEISAPRFTRSIINSCAQLAYEHAQTIIDNPAEDLDNNDLPDILNEWTPNDVKWRVLFLHHIAQKLKHKRYKNGAISINNPKLRFQLDPKTGEPLSFEIERRLEAHFLIEELMLLANQFVAKFIHDSFPDKSILRNHAPPLDKSLKSLKERMKNIGIAFDITSSKSISESMQRLCKDADDPKAIEACINAILTKPMARAKYFCSEGKTSQHDFWHFALSIPIYTHFTSPIRRYADILVHRLLAAALNYCPPPQRTTDELHQLAKIMNEQKFKAKKAGDDCILLLYKRYLKAKGKITLDAVVCEITESAVNVVTIDTGHTISIVYHLYKNICVQKENIPDSVLIYHKLDDSLNKKLQLFSKVKIDLVLQNDKLFGSLSYFEVTPEYMRSCKADSTPTTSTESKKERLRDKRGGKKGKTTQGYLAFYAVKN